MTERGLIQHISTLRAIVGSLRAVASQPHTKGLVGVDPDGVRRNADLLDEIAESLLELVPEDPISLRGPAAEEDEAYPPS